MKSGTRFLGIDDSAHDKFEDDTAYLIGVSYRGTEFIEDIREVEIEVDGGDATEKVIELYNSAEASTIGCIFLDGISFAGLNIVDIEKISEEVGVPVVAVTKNEPDREKFYEALEIVGNEDGFLEMQEPQEVQLEDGKVFIQFSGIDFEDAEDAVRRSIIHGQVPECIRVADMIGRII